MLQATVKQVYLHFKGFKHDTNALITLPPFLHNFLQIWKGLQKAFLFLFTFENKLMLLALLDVDGTKENLFILHHAAAFLS